MTEKKQEGYVDLWFCSDKPSVYEEAKKISDCIDQRTTCPSDDETPSYYIFPVEKQKEILVSVIKQLRENSKE